MLMSLLTSPLPFPIVVIGIGKMVLFCTLFGILFEMLFKTLFEMLFGILFITVFVILLGILPTILLFGAKEPFNSC